MNERKKECTKERIKERKTLKETGKGDGAMDTCRNPRVTR